MDKRILIVDDEENIAVSMADVLIGQEAGYQVAVANSGEEALSRMAAQTWDLVVTDLRMPGINGLELIKQARTRFPHTHHILMTAHGDTHIEATAYWLGVSRYLSKPFRMPELVTAVQSVFTREKISGRDILVLSDKQFDEITRCLTDLRTEVKAQCILLANVAGQMLTNVGTMDGVDMQVLISLIGGSFATAVELPRQLGEQQALTLNYHECTRMDIYSANVNEDLFIVLLFDKLQHVSPIGMVWLYTRRMLKQLQGLVIAAERVEADQVLDDDFGVLLSDSLDQLFTNASTSGTGLGGEIRTCSSECELMQEEIPQVIKNLKPEKPETSRCAAETSAVAAADIFNFNQAVKKGLINPLRSNNLGNKE